jgi:hypothetical protein
MIGTAMRLTSRIASVALAGLVLLCAGCVHPAAAPRSGATQASATRQAAATPFRFVQITDTHYGPPLHLARTRQAVDAINALPMPIAFVVHSGDFASDNLTVASAVAISNEFSRLDAPFFIVPGNHDIVPRRLGETLQAYVGSLGPLAARYETNGVAFLFLYTEPLRTGIAVPDFDPIEWLSSQLAVDPEMPCIVVHHAPDGPDFYRNEEHEGWPAASRRRWLETLSRGNVQAVLAGHFHRDAIQWNELDIPTYTAAPIAGYWGRQGSFRIYTYDGVRLSYQTVYLDDAPPE